MRGSESPPNGPNQPLGNPRLGRPRFRALPRLPDRVEAALLRWLAAARRRLEPNHVFVPNSPVYSEDWSPPHYQTDHFSHEESWTRGASPPLYSPIVHTDSPDYSNYAESWSGFRSPSYYEIGDIPPISVEGSEGSRTGERSDFDSD